MEWIEILKALGFTTAAQILVLIVIGFFSKKLFEFFFSETLEIRKSELNQGLENHKQKLKDESDKYKLTLDKEMEVFRGGLSKISFEHQTRYQQLHTDRAETIKKLFGLLYDLEAKMESLMRPFQAAGEKPLEDKFKEAGDAANDFVKFYKSNEILFSVKTCKVVEQINESFLNAWRAFTTSRQFGKGASIDLSHDLLEKEMDAYYKTILKEIPELKEVLIDPP